MSRYSRAASGFRPPRGLKTNAQPNSMPEDRGPIVQNTRDTIDDAQVSRAQVAVISTSNASSPVLALEPSIGVFKAGTSVFVEGIATPIDTGYALNQGCSLVPFRPDTSIAPWEYIWDGSKSTKYLPSAGTLRKTGIAEPQAPCDAFLDNQKFSVMYQEGIVTTPTPSGTASAVSAGTRLSDTATAVFQLPNDPSAVQIIQVSSGKGYQSGMIIQHNTSTAPILVTDVYPRLSGNLAISGIYYYSGTTGRCVVQLKGGA